MTAPAALVTGAARGLGESVCRRLLADGWTVALVDVDEAVGRTASRLAGEVGAAVAVPIIADVSRAGDVESAVDAAVGELGGLDLVVNNAGIGGGTRELADTPIDEIRRVLEVNLLGTIFVSRAAARAMVPAGRGGSIVNIGSIFGQQGVGRSVAYGASKGGITLVTQALAMELAPHHIRVNTIAPGNMATDMHWDDLRDRAAATGVPFEALVEEVRRTIPLGRHGTGDDVAGAVVWLASADASYVTGQTIGVNGGVFRT
ncbi:MAG TPA: SDR family oxidoreductase [Vitreimonas sp.]|nr:SDR family oxidoreductase [Vitreimonas sp.]